MFTGLIETIGTIREYRPAGESLVLGIVPAAKNYTVSPGDSVAINGVCLTLEKSAADTLFFRAVAETVSRSTLKNLRNGSRVNMERALRPMDRMGGHFVLGHIDGIATLLTDRSAGDSVIRTISIPSDLCVFMAHKGSVALDGVSLTIAASRADSIDISLIPYSLSHTTMMNLSPGDEINIECDMMARYIIHGQRYAASTPEHAGTAGCGLYEKLERLGF